MAGTLTASVIKNDTTSPPAFQNSAGTEIGRLARAYCYFDGTLASPSATGFNVSSVTKNGTGDYTLNFTNALPSATPSYGFSTNSNDRVLVYVSSSTTTLRVQNKNSGAGNYDQSYISLTVFA